MRPLTDRQRRILQVIQLHIYDKGYPPTLREIMAATGIRCPNGVKCHIKALQAKGWIRLGGPGGRRAESRTITLVEPISSLPATVCDCLPVAGTVDSDTGRITITDTSILDDVA